MKNKIKNEDLLKSVCQMYNTQDVKCLYGKTTENMVYESQWVLTPLTGNKKIYRYLKF